MGLVILAATAPVHFPGTRVDQLMAPTSNRPPNRPSGGLSIRERAGRVRFRRAMSLMLMTLLVPGSAQFVYGDRRIGRVALSAWAVVVLTGLGVLVSSLASRQTAFSLVSNTSILLVVRLVLLALAIGWVALFMDAWRLGQPLTLRQQHRLVVVGLNGFLSLGMAGVLLFGAHLVAVQRDLMITMFGSGDATGAHHGRYNVLLLGGDSGAGRWGLRPDSMTIASIDAETGKTVLISLPRNMQNFPFREGSTMAKEFPDGFNLEGQYLNGVSTWAEDHTALFKKSEHPGIDATVQAIEGISGLRINYWAMVNLQGFRDLVDAVGGVRLNVRQPIPVGGLGSDVTGFIEPGVRVLNGHDTLWFARSREGSDDYSRMARQKCVMGAMLGQVSPQVAVRNFQDIAEASSDMISTNLPGKEVGRFMDLALKAKSQKISTLSLVPPLVNTAEPDIALIHAKVEESIAASEGRPAEVAAAPTDTSDTSGGEQAEPPAAPVTETAVKPKKKPKAPESVTGGSVGSLGEGYAANQADDLSATC